MESGRNFAAGEVVVVASHNSGKVREIAELLAPYSVRSVSSKDYPFPEPEETGLTFRENSEIKALSAAATTGMIALADDSGLEIDALGGEPGVLSARWAGPEKDFNKAMQRVEELLVEKNAVDPDMRRANFICDLCLAEPEGDVWHFEGRVFGTLTWPPRGNKGFGYDPIFVPDGHSMTFGEMDEFVKHQISHRAQAFRHFVEACF